MSIFIPIGYVTWDDEYPGDRPVPTGDSEGYSTMATLHAARWHYWMEEEIPEAYAELWKEAQEQLPDWPGFQRLYVDEATKTLARD